MALEGALLDAHSSGVMRMLEEVYPAFCKKIFENNNAMRQLVMHRHSPLEILEYPVCGKCESLALPDARREKDGKMVPVCTCIKEGCGATTVNPPTLKEWIAYECKKRAPLGFANALEYAIDDVAYSMFAKYLREVADAKKRVQPQNTSANSPKSLQQPNVLHRGELPTDQPTNEKIILLGDEENV